MPEKKTVVMTDSACDMPYDLEASSGVEILPFSIVLDGVSYVERQDFNFEEYYDMLRTCEGVPTTSQVTTMQFTEAFERHHAAGAEQLLYVSINGTGSATNDNAHIAREAFYKKFPQSRMAIHIVDSHSYSMVYGWYTAEAARKLKNGAEMEDVVAWLEDVFSQTEIVLAAFSLRFMKKSGRISAAAAFAGELLGLRPVLTLNDGVSEVQRKIRGDKDVLPAMVDYAKAHISDNLDYMVGGTDDEKVAELAALCEKTWRVKPLVTFKLGAAVATNTGPDAIAVVYLGPRRPR